MRRPKPGLAGTKLRNPVNSALVLSLLAISKVFGGHNLCGRCGAMRCSAMRPDDYSRRAARCASGRIRDALCILVTSAPRAGGARSRCLRPAAYPHARARDDDGDAYKGRPARRPRRSQRAGREEAGSRLAGGGARGGPCSVSSKASAAASAGRRGAPLARDVRGSSGR
eukprot:scaffold1291_cov412-Prasinococcus_capsulatus_cf.AAC.19